MSRTRARLAAAVCDGHSRWHASATAPQRWVVRRDGERIEAVHQLLGDGLFGGDVHRLVISVHAGANVVVRSLAATPLRPGAPSVMAVRMRVAGGGRLLYLPGALIPQAASVHVSTVTAEIDEGGAAVIASCVMPGRIAMGEYAAFGALRLRTDLRVARTAAFREDARLGGSAGVLALFGKDDAALTVIAAGASKAAETGWWRQFSGTPGVTGGASPLRAGGVSFRSLCRSLGDAQALLASIEEALA